MLPVSAGFLEALASSQRIAIRADVTKGTQRLYTGLPVTGGSVSMTRGQVTRRTTSLTIAPRLATGPYRDRPALPEAPGDPLGHYGQELRLWWELHYVGGGVESIPLGVFRIDSTSGSIAHDEAVSVTGVSREAFVADDAFLQPRTLSSASATSLIASLIRETLPTADVAVTATRDTRVTDLVVDQDRWGAIQTIAEAIPAAVYADAWGRFIIADPPAETTQPVWQVRAGRGGSLVRADQTSSRDAVRNAVVVRGTSPSGDFAPLQAAVFDDTPGSPTRYGDPAAGHFGKIPEFITNPLVATLDQARAVGRAKLAQLVGAASTINASSIPNPALEVGDVVDVIPDPDDPVGSVRRHILDSINLTLNPGGAFTMTTRDIRSGTQS